MYCLQFKFIPYVLRLEYRIVYRSQVIYPVIMKDIFVYIPPRGPSTTIQDFRGVSPRGTWRIVLFGEPPSSLPSLVYRVQTLTVPTALVPQLQGTSEKVGSVYMNFPLWEGCVLLFDSTLHLSPSEPSSQSSLSEDKEWRYTGSARSPGDNLNPSHLPVLRRPVRPVGWTNEDYRVVVVKMREVKDRLLGVPQGTSRSIVT